MYDCKYKVKKIKFNFKHIDGVRADKMFLFRSRFMVQPNIMKKL